MSGANPSEAAGLTATQLSQLHRLAQQAGKTILEVYRDERHWQTRDKQDNTPVTAADIASSKLLESGLPAILEYPVVSEEALPSFSQRLGWKRYWLVDPMDGTREFLLKTDEFVINIALMEDHQPIFGYVYQPTAGISWWGGPKTGAFYGTPDDFNALPKAALGRSLVALGSRRSQWQGPWRQRLQAAGYRCETQALGSALKFMRLAEGSADLYPRLGPTSEWDTAAPQAILEATGGAICQWDGSPLSYGKANLANPYFIAVRDKSLLAVLLNDLK